MLLFTTNLVVMFEAILLAIYGFLFCANASYTSTATIQNPDRPPICNIIENLLKKLYWIILIIICIAILNFILIFFKEQIIALEFTHYKLFLNIILFIELMFVSTSVFIIMATIKN